jgi:hypothetical protein
VVEWGERGMMRKQTGTGDGRYQGRRKKEVIEKEEGNKEERIQDRMERE